MATLPSGAPYMEGTDAANTIDSYTLANAEYWDARTPLDFRQGTITVSAPSGSAATATITFSPAFPAGSTVRVFLTLTSSISGAVNVAITSASPTTATYRAYQTTGSTQPVACSYYAIRVA
jgi:hypothetical protein